MTASKYNLIAISTSSSIHIDLSRSIHDVSMTIGTFYLRSIILIYLAMGPWNAIPPSRPPFPGIPRTSKFDRRVLFLFIGKIALVL